MLSFAHGFTRARCDDCGHDCFAAFSCKGRGVCPSRNTRRMAETEAHLADHVFPRLSDGYLFANARASRIKLLVHDGFGVWCAARRLNTGRFVWPREIGGATPLALTQAQFDALVVGLPWQRLPEMSVITRL